MLAPAGAFTSRPMAMMRPPCITMVTPLCGAAPLPSISVALVEAIVQQQQRGGNDCKRSHSRSGV
jgi:hypothetical protein